VHTQYFSARSLGSAFRAIIHQSGTVARGFCGTQFSGHALEPEPASVEPQLSLNLAGFYEAFICARVYEQPEGSPQKQHPRPSIVDNPAA